MRYTTAITINLPRNRVIDLFDNSDNIKKWQPELIKFEHLSGTPGQNGAKTKMLYNMGGRETEMVETIVERNFPDSFSATYETKGVKNMLENEFIALDENTTKWKMISEFSFSGFYKLMGLLMPGAFKKQSLKTMNQFKNFAESEG